MLRWIKDYLIKKGWFGPYWITADNRVLLIRKMDNNHLTNTLRFLNRKSKRGTATISQKETLTLMKAECFRRNISWQLPKQIYYRPEEKMNCPACNKLVISPPLHLCEGERLPAIEKSHCCWCGRNLMFLIPESPGDIIVRLEPGSVAPFRRYSLEKTWGGTGMQGTTEIIIQQQGNDYEARLGFAIMGSVGNEASIGASPFDPMFHDNYASGHGKSEREAVEALAKELEANMRGLWA